MAVFIGEVKIAADTDGYVVAEIGHNHQGDVGLCKEMILSAKRAGANAVKLQKRDNRTLFTPEFYNSPYHGENSFGFTYGAHREALEFSGEEFLELKKYANEIGITLFSTVFDIPSADLLSKLDFPAYKIASADLKNSPLLNFVARIGKPMILSTGGSSLDDVKRAVDTITSHNDQLVLLQCTSCYPAEDRFINLEVIRTYQKQFPDLLVGYSGHEVDLLPSLLAFAIGARVIERHFTFDKAAKGSDHKMSLNPTDLQELITNLRRVNVLLGDGTKKYYEVEADAFLKLGKKIVASRDLPNGHSLAGDDFELRSPGDGLSPEFLDEIIGRTLKADLQQYETISLEALE